MDNIKELEDRKSKLREEILEAAVKGDKENGCKLIDELKEITKKNTQKNLNVRMSEEEYNKIKEDAVKAGFGTTKKPNISDYIKFITKNVEISVKIKE